MPCPSCNSHDLWDDNLAWGCNKCKFFTTGNVVNNYSDNDTFNNSSSDVEENISWTPLK